MAGKIRVLYVDDESTLLELCKLFLERSGDFTVAIATSAPEAIRILGQERFDTIVSDYQMPEMDGIEFLKNLKSKGNTTPFIIFTGKGREEVVIEALNAGADFYIQKGGEIKAQFAELAHKIKKAKEGRRAEEAFKESEERFRSLFHKMLNGFAVHEILCDETGKPYDYRFLDINPAFERMTGLSRESVIGKTVLQVLPKTEPIWIERYGKVALTGEPDYFVEHSREFDKSFEVMVYQNAPRQFTTIFSDVTERRKAEEALRESQVHLDLALRSLEMGVWHWDIIKDVRYFDAQTCHLLGIDPTTFTGSAEEFFAVVHPDDREKLKTALARTIEHNVLYEPSYRAVWSDGSNHHITTRGKLLRNTAGKPERINGIIWDITDREKVDDALRQSEERYRAVVEDQSEFICRFNPDGKLTFVNDAYCRYFGLDRTRCLGKLHTVKLTPEDARLMSAHLESLTSQNPVVTIEHRIIMPSGEVRWQRWNDRAIFSENSKVIEYQSVGRDITEQKRIETELRSTKRRLADIINWLPDPTFVIDSAGTVTAWNHAMEDLAGVSAAEMVGKGDYAYALPFYGKRRKILIDLALQYDENEIAQYSNISYEGKTLVGDTTVATPLAKNAILWGKATPLYDDEGNVIGAVEVIRDITDRKRADEEIRTLQQFQQSIIENAKVWISVLDPKGTILVWNTTAEQISGYPARDVIGKNTVWKQLYPDPVYRKQVAENILDITKKNTYVENFETRVRAKSGDEKIIWWNTQPVRDASGKPVQFIAIGRDVTERKRAEEALQESEERYREFFTISRDSVFITTPEGRWIDFNDALVEMFGFDSRKEMLEVPVSSIYANPEERSLFTQHIIREGYVKEYPLLLKRKEGTVFDTIITTVPVRNQDGSIKAFIGTIRDVTEQKRAEHEIRSLQQFQQSIIENANVWISVLGPKGTILVWNTTAEQISGYLAKDVIGTNTIWKHLYPDPVYRKQVAENILDIIKKNTYVENFETRVRTKSGDEKIIWWNTQPLRDASGKPVQFITIGRDNTERKQVEEELRESEERYSSLFDNSNSVSLLIDPDTGRIMDANAAAARYYGYTRDILISMGIYDLNRLPKETVIGNLQRAKDEKAKHFFSSHYLATGEKRNVEIYSGPITLHGKSLFYSIIHDITERRQAEERIKALRQFEESVIKNANIWISVLDGKGNVSVWNRAAEEISGYKSDEVVGKNTIWSRMYPEKEYRHTVTTTIKEIIGAHKYLENFETRIRTKDGQERIIWWNTRALKDVPGIDETFIAIGKDVTEQKTLSDAVQLANKKLNLLSSITRHDIKNQLMALLAYLELCGEGGSSPAQQTEYIKKAQQIAGTIDRQINMTRDYQEMGIAAPIWQNANECIRKAMAALPVRSVHIEVDPAEPEVYSDPLVEKVFYNLIDNALRYGGADMKTIRFSSQESVIGLTILCEDDGVGISAEDKKKLFTRGFGKHTGLGLFLSREILAITGITITENGVPGKGARFEILVPKGEYRFTALGGI